MLGVQWSKARWHGRAATPSMGNVGQQSSIPSLTEMRKKMLWLELKPVCWALTRSQSLFILCHKSDLLFIMPVSSSPANSEASPPFPAAHTKASCRLPNHQLGALWVCTFVFFANALKTSIILVPGEVSICAPSSISVSSAVGLARPLSFSERSPCQTCMLYPASFCGDC